jgi:hypothetical protein
MTQADLDAARYELSQILARLRPAPSGAWIAATVDELLRQFDAELVPEPKSATA